MQYEHTTHTIHDFYKRGYLIYESASHGFCVAMLFVYPSLRFKGVASGLLQQLCDLADARGLPIMLTARPIESNATALPYGLLREFYERRGFVDQGDYTEHFVRQPDETKKIEIDPREKKDSKRVRLDLFKYDLTGR